MHFLQGTSRRIERMKLVGKNIQFMVDVLLSLYMIPCKERITSHGCFLPSMILVVLELQVLILGVVNTSRTSINVCVSGLVEGCERWMNDVFSRDVLELPGSSRELRY